MKKISIEIKWSLFFIAMMLLWMWLEKILGFHGANIENHAIVTNFVAIPAILIFVLALRDKRINYYSGYMNYIQGFVSGMIITSIVTLITPITQYITSEIITPEYFPNIINYTVEQGEMTREAAEKYFNLNNYMIQATIGAFVMGTITTAIVAIFTMKRNKTA